MSRSIPSSDLEEIRRAIGGGHGLPPHVYTEPSVYETETERLFRDGWMCVGRTDQIPESGDYLTLDLLGEPLLVVRGKDASIRILSRVCRHRSADLLPGRPPMARGNASGFACPYHAWSYRLDGRLAGAPMMKDSSALDRDGCRLPEFRAETWQGWIFVNLSGNASPFRDGLGALDEFLKPYRLDEMVVAGVREFESPWNWKVLVDNFMESYHHIATHRQSLQSLFPAKDSYVPDNAGPYSLLVMPSIPDPAGSGSPLPQRSLPDDRAGALVAGVVYPFHLFAVSADALTWYQLIPDAHDRFKLRVSVCVDAVVAGDENLSEALEAQMEITTHVHMEDIGACDAVWTGLKSRGAVAGPLAPQERALAQFATWWVERLGARSLGDGSSRRAT